MKTRSCRTLRRTILDDLIAGRLIDCLIAESLLRTLAWRCPRCHHLAGYRTAGGAVRCWWPDCGDESDGRDFVEMPE